MHPSSSGIKGGCRNAFFTSKLPTLYRANNKRNSVPPGTFADLVGYIERGEIKPLLAETFTLKELSKAQAAFTAKNHLGNIVVVIE